MKKFREKSSGNLWRKYYKIHGFLKKKILKTPEN
jgi:hypothetical protein